MVDRFPRLRCEDIADQLDVPEQTVRAELHRAVRAWNDDPSAGAAAQLDRVSDLRARLQEAIRATPEDRWVTVAAEIDPRLPEQEDWPALARMMQHIHDEGHDIESIARASVAVEPLLDAMPAQDLRYRLAVLAPPVAVTAPAPVDEDLPARPDSERTHLVHRRPASGWAAPLD